MKEYIFIITLVTLPWIIASAVWALLVAFIFQLACRMVVKFKPPYGKAYTASFCFLSLTILPMVVAAYVFQIDVSAVPFSELPLEIELLQWISLPTTSFVCASLITYPQTGTKIGLGRASLVTLLLVGLFLAFVLLVTLSIAGLVIWHTE